jgi:hypothetical protein
MANGNYTAYELAELQKDISDSFRTATQGQQESNIQTTQVKKNLQSQLLEDIEKEESKVQELLDKERDTGLFGKLFNNPFGNIIASINPVLGGIKAVSSVANKLKDQKFEERKLKRILDNLSSTKKYKGTTFENLYKQNISGIEDFVQDKYDEISDIKPLDIVKDVIPEFIKDKALGETTGNIFDEFSEKGSDKTLLERIMSSFGRGDDKKNQKAFLTYLQSILRK